jgi:hypothetical protein
MPRDKVTKEELQGLAKLTKKEYLDLGYLDEGLAKLKKENIAWRSK